MSSVTPNDSFVNSSADVSELPLCTICLDPMKNHLTQLSCSHMFHTICVASAFNFSYNSTPLCPLCRQPQNFRWNEENQLFSNPDSATQSPLCSFCQTSLNSDVPSSTLPCGCKLHFPCVPLALNDDSSVVPVCPTCDTTIPCYTRPSINNTSRTVLSIILTIGTVDQNYYSI